MTTLGATPSTTTFLADPVTVASTVKITGNDQAFILRNDTNMGISDSGGNITLKAPGNVFVNADSDASGAGAVSIQSQGNNYMVIGPSQSGVLICVSATTAQKLGFFGTTPVTAKTGWAVATGTATRTTFDTTTVTLAQLAEHVKALIDDLHQTAGYGIIRT